MRLQDLTVTLTTITPAVGAVGPCTAADFAIGQLTGNADLVLPPRSSQTLSALGVTNADLPRLTMLNSALNQDGCKSAVVNLHYHGDALAGGGGGGGGNGGGHGSDHDHGGDGDGSDHSDGDGDSGPTHTGSLPGTGGSHVQDMTAAASALIMAGAATVAIIRRRRSTD
jgi:hypothetical protein